MRRLVQYHAPIIWPLNSQWRQRHWSAASTRSPNGLAAPREIDHLAKRSRAGLHLQNPDRRSSLASQPTRGKTGAHEQGCENLGFLGETRLLTRARYSVLATAPGARHMRGRWQALCSNDSAKPASALRTIPFPYMPRGSELPHAGVISRRRRRSST